MNNSIILKIAEENPWMTDDDRLVNIYWALSQLLVFEVPGAVVEVGSHSGSTAAFLQMIIDHFDTSRELHVYDSFEGMPEPGPEDAYLIKGDRAATVDDLKKTFAHYGVKVPEIHRGWFHETLPAGLPQTIAFAYLDGDFYDSITVSLEHVWPRLSPGGLVLVDDYADLECSPRAWAKLPGVKLACDDFFVDKESKPFTLVGTTDLAFACIRKPIGK